MKEDLSDKRQQYTRGDLLETSCKSNPIEQFRDWYKTAEESELVSEANAMAISTVEHGSVPRTRMVLLKGYTYEGFIFYTNYNSRKAKALEQNPEMCLHFFWQALERQVIINARVEKLPENTSDGYFEMRPRGSQLGALVSPQSEVIPNRDYLETKLKEAEKTYEGKEIIRPSYWGGYLARPYQFEFWQGRPNRLHDRIFYQLDEEYNWIMSRLAP